MADLDARTSAGQRPMDLATNEAMRQAIINEEERRRNHGFKRAVLLPISPTLVVQERNENGVEGGQATASAMANVEAGEEDDDDEDEDSSSSDEED